MRQSFARTAFALILLVPAAALAAEPDPGIQRIFDRANVNYQVDAAGDFRATFTTGGNRTQLVVIRSGIDKVGDVETREIRSIGYRSPSDPFPTDVATRLLAENNTRVLGQWGKQMTLGVLAVRIPPDADAGTVLEAVSLAARDADAMEKALTPERDEF